MEFQGYRVQRFERINPLVSHRCFVQWSGRLHKDPSRCPTNYDAPHSRKHPASRKVTTLKAVNRRAANQKAMSPMAMNRKATIRRGGSQSATIQREVSRKAMSPMA